MDVLDSGAHGLIPGADLTASLAVAWRAHQRGDRDAAQREYVALLPLIVFQAQSLGLLIGGAKLLLERRGVIATTRARHADAELSRSTSERMFQLAQAAGVS
jgi:dihydrodipicolinate synthase/N-acetylneuraminate lyase